MGRFLELLNKKLRVVEKTDYDRPEYNSYMSGPEWRNVEIAQEFAQFLHDGRSIFRYPYLQQIFDLWKVVFNSYSAARRYNGRMEILTSEYMVMDVFVGFFTTMELLPKGMLSLMLRPFLNAENKTQMQHELAEYFSKYAADLQTVPFYDQKYAEIRAVLAQAYRSAQQKTWGDWFSWKCVSLELMARHWISKPLHAWFHSEDNIVPPTTDVLVKFNVENEEHPDYAKHEFTSRLNRLNGVEVVGKHVYVKPHKEGKNHTSVYALLRAHRYADFQQDIKTMEDLGIKVKKIAGQDQVQVKCEVTANDPSVMRRRLEELKHVPDAPMRYSYGDRIHANRQICMFDVPVKKLQETVDKLNHSADVRVQFIHNF